jgi:hypothetical protein
MGRPVLFLPPAWPNARGPRLEGRRSAQQAALDDINIDRFLRLVRRFAERSQFIVVRHQKRTMDAAAEAAA